MPRRPPGGRLRIVVLGYVVRGPLGGLAWHHLQYVTALRALGHDVSYIEDSGDAPNACTHLDRAPDDDPAEGLAFTSAAFGRLGFDRWAYYDAPAASWRGPAGDSAPALVAKADVLLNVSCANPIRPWARHVPVRVAIDTDPAFTQVRNLTEPAQLARYLEHNAFFTFGENVPDGRSLVPSDGITWRRTRQPVALELWPVTPGRPDAAWSTVMQWDSYQVRECAGVRYGMKSESFRDYADMPCLSGHRFQLALPPTPPIGSDLERRGWELVDGLQVTHDPWTYQAFLQQSTGEFSVAKHGYVVSRCGWFSERTAAYLASGRPVVVQDTGFSDWLPTGRGVVAFSTPMEAVMGVEAIRGAYAMHCRAAREIAEEFFDARKVLQSLLDRAMGDAAGGSHSPVAVHHD